MTIMIFFTCQPTREEKGDAHEKIFLILMLVLAGYVNGHQSEPADLEKIICTVSERVIENKVYLKPGLVHIAPDAILLQVENAFAPIERLFADEDGVYIDMVELAQLIWCDKCKRYYDPEKQYSTCYHNHKKKKSQ